MHPVQSDQVENYTDPVDEIFFDKIPDEAIERAAQVWETGAFTLGNCTGLGSCPA
jgi:hypothetical protein